MKIKSGAYILTQLLSPRIKKGPAFAATPASDIVCGPSQLASGITLQVFMTGRGTPYGLAEATVIKVSFRNDMQKQWNDLTDFTAGGIATGEESVEEASGRKKPYTEEFELNNSLYFFNPAPIT